MHLSIVGKRYSADSDLTSFYINTRDEIANGLQLEKFTQKANQLLLWTLTRQKSLASNIV